MRLDILLVHKGFFPSRELAKINIKKGNVVVNGSIATKPSQEVSDAASVSVISNNVIPYVSRGGLKLEKALREFGIDCTNLDVLDIGASTGGFTDCVLKHGARKVYAVDVGTDQLSPMLKGDSRVVSIENTNIKELTPEMVNSTLFHLVVADLSFISLTKVIEFFPQFLLPQGMVIVLIKPQFEAGAEFIGKRGIVKETQGHIRAINNVCDAAKRHGLYLKNITRSPVIEEKKNIEFLALFDKFVGKNDPEQIFSTVLSKP